jgi:diguanylate cyclase (GGDEF)-like protein
VNPSKYNIEPSNIPDVAFVAIAGLTAYLGVTRQKYKRENKQLHHELAHDDLTGLLTRRAFSERVNKRLAEAKPSKVYAMLFVDADNFKAINDKHPGRHAEGDDILKRIARGLERHTRQGEQLGDLLAHGKREDSEPARMGGDEFAVFAELTSRNEHGEAMSDQEKLDAFVARVNGDLSAEFQDRSDLEEYGFGVSVAGTLAQSGDTAESMLARSDYELKSVKAVHHEVQGSYRS